MARYDRRPRRSARIAASRAVGRFNRPFLTSSRVTPERSRLKSRITKSAPIKRKVSMRKLTEQLQRTSLKRRRTRLYQSVGAYGGRFRKSYAFSATKYQRRGIVMHIEGGNVVARGGTPGTKQVVYIGHGCPLWQTWFCVCQYVVKDLFRRQGVLYTSQYDKPQELGSVHVVAPGAIVYGYQTTEGGQQLYARMAINADENFYQISLNLFTAWNALMSANNYIQFTTAELTDDPTGVSTSLSNSRLRLTELILDICNDAKLALQNRTVASSAVGNDESSMLDVSNNPLGGKSYEGRGAGPTPKWRLQSALVNDPYVDQNSGVIDWNIDQAGFTANMIAQYSRPPPGTAFENCKKVGNVFLKPGEIKNSFLRTKVKMYFNTLCQIARSQMQIGIASTVNTTFGSYRMFCFEKKVNTTVDEPAISVGYEHNQTFRVCGFYKKASTVPLQLQI